MWIMVLEGGTNTSEVVLQMGESGWFELHLIWSSLKISKWKTSTDKGD